MSCAETFSWNRNVLISDHEYFQSEEVTFTCEHNKALNELSVVEWKLNTTTESIAVMYIDEGTISTRTYGSEFKNRATDFNSTSLTITGMKSSDDGEFSCTVTLSDDTTTYVVTNFSVTVKGKEFCFNL